MRQFMHKSGLLFGVFIMVSIIFTLCGSAVEKKKEPKKVVPILSNEYSIIKNKDNENVSTYLDILEKKHDSIVNGIMFRSSLRAISANEVKNIPVEKVSGRWFSESDIIQKTNTALVREDYLKLCDKRNQNYYYSYDGVSYEVIGTYRDLESSSVYSPKCLINLYAEGIQQLQWNYGFMDTTEENYDDWYSYMKKNGYSLEKATQSEYFASFGTNIDSMIMIFVAMLFMILLHSFSATSNWMEGRKKEVTIRRMVGANWRKIYTWMLKQYCICLLSSQIIGMMITKVILLINYRWNISYTFSAMFGTNLSWKSFLLNLVLYFIMGNFFVMIMCLKQRKKTIVYSMKEI